MTKAIAKIVRRMVRGIIAAIVVAFLAVTIVVHTHGFLDLLRVRIVDYLNQNYRGRFTIGQLSGSIFGDLTLGGVGVEYGDSRVVSVRAIRLQYQLIPILENRLNITRLSVEAPALSLVQAHSGEWNLAAALSERHPSSASSTLAIWIYDLALARGDIRINASDGRTCDISNTNIVGAISTGRASTRVNIGNINAAISSPGYPNAKVAGDFAYSNVDDRSSSIRIARLSLQTTNSELFIRGSASGARDKAIDLRLSLKRLAARDIDAFFPRVGMGQDVSGVVRITGQMPSGIRVESAIGAGESHLKTKILANLEGKEPIYDARADLEDVNLHQLITSALANDLPEGAISGTVRASGHGKNIAGLRAQAELVDRGAAMKGWQAGDVSLNAALQAGVVTVAAKLEGKAGRAFLNGAIDTTEAESYNLHFATSHLELRKMSASARIPPDDLNLVLAVRGAGFETATMDAVVQLSCQRSSIGAAILDRGVVQARIHKGTLQIHQAEMQAEGSELSVRGQIGLTSQRRGDLHYTLKAETLKPWMAMVGRRGDGTLDLAGDAAGNSRAMRISGMAQFSQLHIDKYAVEHGRLSYNLAGLGKPNTIRGQVGLTFSDVRAGIALKSMRTDIRLEPGRTQTGYVSIYAVQESSRVDTLAFNVNYQPRRLSTVLTGLSLATDAGTWRLQNTAAIVRESNRISIHDLTLQNHKQIFTLNGEMSNNGRQNLFVQVQRLRLAPFAETLTGRTELDGVLSMRLGVSGSAETPRITLASNVTDIQAQGIRCESLSANVEYLHTKASFTVRLQQDRQHWMDATGSVPIRLGWARGFEHRIVGDLDLQAHSPGLDLAAFQTVTGGTIRDAGGTISFGLTLRGPPRHPLPAGQIALTDGHAFIRPLGVQISKAMAQINLNAQELRIATLSASAGEGVLTGRGVVNLRDAIPAAANVRVTFDNWPAIRTTDYQATIAGSLACEGPMNGLHVGGRTEVLNALLRPDLNLMEGQSLKPDHTIKVERTWKVATPVSNEQSKQTAGSSVYKNMSISLDAIIHRNTWIKTADGEVELQGAVHLSKAPDAEPTLSGSINSVRGILLVAGKAFTVKEAHILFTGGHQIDPSLDIAALYTVSNYEITAKISGTAKKPELALSSIPNLPQSDILSVLMFGKPADQLSSGEQKGLQNQALSMAGGYAAGQLGQAIAQSLGLETLGIGTTPGGLGVSHYLTQNIYISASQATTGTTGQNASVSFYLTPHLELDTSASTRTRTGNQIELNWEREY
jgi:autotransporter translocation and assembly factor TamB